MKIQHYTAIAIKFIALLLFLNALRLALLLFQVPFTIDYVVGGNGFFLVGSILIVLIFSFCCWFLPMTLAKWLIKPVPNLEFTAMSAGTFLRTLVTFLGLYLVIDVLFSSSRLVFQYFWIEAIADEDYHNSLKVTYAIVVFQFIIGLTLLSKNYWITQALLKINAPEPATDSKLTDQTD